MADTAVTESGASGRRVIDGGAVVTGHESFQAITSGDCGAAARYAYAKLDCLTDLACLVAADFFARPDPRPYLSFEDPGTPARLARLRNRVSHDEFGPRAAKRCATRRRHSTKGAATYPATSLLIRILGLLLGVATLLIGAPAAGAVVRTETFDDFAVGTTVSDQVRGVVFPDRPEVFAPMNTTTSSPPLALRTTQPCPAACYRLRLRFPEPTSYVKLNVGVDSVIGSEFGTQARLEAYGAHGELLQATPQTSVQEPNEYGPIVTPLEINRGSTFDIASAIVFVGGDDSGFNFPGAIRVDVDDLTINLPGGSGPPPPPPTPGPPSIEITNPPDGYVSARPDIGVGGRVSAAAGVRRFCVTTSATTSLPARCDQSSRLAEESDPSTPATHRFASLPVTLERTRNTVTAWVQDNYGRVARDSVVIRLATGIDLAAESMDVTQGIQSFQLPVPSGSAALVPGVRARHPVATYRGVRLVRGKRTIVRLYGRALRTGDLGSSFVGPVSARLWAYRATARGPRLLIPSPLLPDDAPLTLGSDASLAQRRASPRGAFVFTLPEGWTVDDLILVGEVNPVDSAPRVPECAGCAANNAFAVTGLRFHRRRRVTVNPIAMWFRMPVPPTTVAPPADPAAVYADFRKVSPLDLRIRPYQGFLDVSDLARRFTPFSDAMKEALLDRVEDWEDDHEVVVPGVELVVGLQTGLHQGVSQSSVSFLFDIQEAVAVADFKRPLTSVGHETGHQLGLAHASAACGGGADGADDWPPDQLGRLQGWGVDPAPGSGRSDRPGLSTRYWLFGRRRAGLFEPGPMPPQPSSYFDLMSYCAGGERPGAGRPDMSWLSVRNWDRLTRRRFPIGSYARTSAAAVTRRSAAVTLRVAAAVRADGSAEILRVERGDGTVTAADPSSPFALRIRNSAGVPWTLPVAPSLLHVDHAGASPTLYVAAEVPAADAASVELVRNGHVLARRVRSASAPRIKLLRPRSRSRSPLRGSVPVRWRARDADGDALRARVELSTNRGRTFRTLTTGISGRRALIPSAFLSRSRNARLRVTVTDGFNEARAMSGRLHVAGHPPVARILDVGRRTAIRGDARLELAGEAFDDAGRAVPPRRLRWRSGRRLVGRGERLSVPAQRLGRRVTLVARDRSGRRGRASVRVRVERVAPAFLSVSAPSRVSRRSRRIRLSVASTLDARFLLSGRGVGKQRRALKARRRTRVLARVRPGSRRVRLRLRLVADHRSTRHSVIVRR